MAVTIGQALYTFFSSFEIPAYSSTSVPDQQDISLPFLTYDYATSFLDGGETSCTVNLYFSADAGEAAPNAKAEDIAAAVGRGGKLLNCDGGFAWIKLGSPFSQPMLETDDIKRRYINLTIEYLR